MPSRRLIGRDRFLTIAGAVWHVLLLVFVLFLIITAYLALIADDWTKASAYFLAVITLVVLEKAGRDR